MKTCWIVGAGDFTTIDFSPAGDDLVIAADGGLMPLLRCNVTPHLLMGDFDSLGKLPSLPQSVEVCTFPVEKDDTDTGLSLREGYARGYRHFRLYGCGGGRLDHLLANMQSMYGMAKKGCSLRLADPEYDLYCLVNGSLSLPPRKAGTLVSVFCFGQTARGVSVRGLQYQLDKQTLTADYPLGVSNHYTRNNATVSVEDGCLFVMVYRNLC